MYTKIDSIINTKEYQNFINNNPGKGNLKVRAYAASEALPVSGLKIEVSTMIDNKKVLFFEGITDSSGMIETISLPAPKLNINNLEIPNTTKYEIDAFFEDSSKRIFYVDMYDGICVVQNINYVTGVNYGN